MNKISLFTAFFLTGISVFAQDINRQKDEAVAEGKRLYESEMASWYGSDLFMEQYKERGNIGGYFSYTDGNQPKCVFFSNGKDPKVIGMIAFDKTYDIKTAKSSFDQRPFTKTEFDLYAIRTAALKAIKSDTLFKHYEQTNLNLIPLISDQKKKVYVLTGPTQNGVVIFGNDYLLTFDNQNNLKTTKRLHANIIPVKYGDKDNISIASMHSHLPETGDLMTPTDICTTMLYEKFTGWSTVYVMSQKYVSIWNCSKDELTLMTRDAFDKIQDDKK